MRRLPPRLDYPHSLPHYSRVRSDDRARLGGTAVAAMPTVTIFNANPLAVIMSVNNGDQFFFPGAQGPAWSPTIPTSGGPTWSNTTPAPNVLAPGPNSLMITPQGAVAPYQTTVNLPANFQWSSIQLYIFFNNYSDVSWMVLNEGQFVTGNLQLSTAR
jgi:hypothetical protein